MESPYSAVDLVLVLRFAKLCWTGLIFKWYILNWGIFIQLVFTKTFPSNMLVCTKYEPRILQFFPVLRTYETLSSMFSLNGTRSLSYQLKKKPIKETYSSSFDTRTIAILIVKSLGKKEKPLSWSKLLSSECYQPKTSYCTLVTDESQPSPNSCSSGCTTCETS